MATRDIGRRRKLDLVSLLRLVQRAVALDAALLSDDAKLNVDPHVANVFEADVAVLHDVCEGVFEICAFDGAGVRDAVVDADAAVSGHPDRAGVNHVGIYAVVFNVDAGIHVGGFVPEAVGRFVDLGVGEGAASEGEDGEVRVRTHG